MSFIEKEVRRVGRRIDDQILQKSPVKKVVDTLTPEIPELPEIPPPATLPDEEEVLRARKRAASRKLQRGRGRAGTILGGGRDTLA
jgi:hypothetical protein